MTAEQGLDAGQDPAGNRDGQLLADDLEQQGAGQIHRRQLGHPRPGIEVRPVVDEPGQHGVGVVKVGAPAAATRRDWNPRSRGPLPPPGYAAPSFMPGPDNLPRLVLPAGLDIEVRARVTLGQIAGDCATRDLGAGLRGAARRNPRMSPAQARCCPMARGAIKMISPVPDHHAGPLASPGQEGTRSTVRQRPARRQIPAAAARGACARRRYSPGPAGLSPVTSRLPLPGRAASPSSQNRPAPLHTKLQPFPADSPRSVSPGGPAQATPSAGADTGTCSLHYRQTCGCERLPPRSHAGQGSPTHPCRTPSGHVVVRAH